MLSAIIVAGGSSRRMGFDKTFALINGRPVIAHSIAAFEATPSVRDIILVGRDERLAELLALVET
ncbi:MAG: NTP transferase domain-containing protein, partial [Chthoniobacterales bacterium]